MTSSSRLLAQPSKRQALKFPIRLIRLLPMRLWSTRPRAILGPRHHAAPSWRSRRTGGSASSDVHANGRRCWSANRLFGSISRSIPSPCLERRFDLHGVDGKSIVAGNKDLFDRFIQSFRNQTMRRSKRLVREVSQARMDERQKFGETLYLLHPNVKRSRGCLRDIQLVRWIGYASYGESDPEQLLQMGLLLPEDFQALRKGYQYLLRLRNQLHFEAGRSQDSLDRSHQVRLAAWAGFQGTEGVLPVEQFMQEYFERTSEVQYSSTHFVDSAKLGSRIVQAISSLITWPISSDSDSAGIKLLQPKRDWPNCNRIRPRLSN